MKKFFNDILTGIDNTTYDIGRVGIAGGLVVYFIIEVIKVIAVHAFNEVDFGLGLVGILTGGAGGLALKHKTEPKGD